MASGSGQRFELAVAAAADNNFAWPAALALLSSATRTHLRVVCLLLGDEIDVKTGEEIAATFARLAVPFEYVPSDLSPFSSLPTRWHLTRASYGRLWIPERANRLSPRTLYLDADTLVLADIAALARLPLSEGDVAAAVPEERTVADPWGVPDWKARGMDASAPYFNSGVMLIDNEEWIRGEVSARAIEALQTPADPRRYATQYALNVALYGRWTPVPELWNQAVIGSPTIRVGPLVASRRSRLDIRRTHILHFWLQPKPWDAHYPPGALTNLYHRAWEELLPVPIPPARTLRAWMRDQRRNRRVWEAAIRKDGWRQILSGDTRAARRTLARSLRVRPYSPRAWVALSLTLCPPVARRLARGRL